MGEIMEMSFRKKEKKERERKINADVLLSREVINILENDVGTRLLAFYINLM